MRPAVLLSLAAGAAAHAVLTGPEARNGATWLPNSTSDACYPGSPACAPYWFTDRTRIPGKQTNCDPAMLTTPRSWGGCGGPGPAPGEPGNKAPGEYNISNPWYSPGTAQVRSPCGVREEYPGGPVTDGADLPETARTVWRAGTTVEVAWAISINHGGGYAYRLCPTTEQMTEACFQHHHLQFVGDTTIVRWINGTEVTIPASTLTTGTTPAGSTWRKNPIPGGSERAEPEFAVPCPGCMGFFHWMPFNIVDSVALPASLAPGDYTLSWRWDAEHNPQVWNNCADVRVVRGS